MYKLVIFDFDGTLADSFASFYALFNQLAEKHGFRRIEPEMVDELRGYGSRQILAHLGIPFWKVPLIVTDMRRRLVERIDEVHLFPGAGAALRGLSELGIESAVLTTNTVENVLRVLGPELREQVTDLECGVPIFGKGRRLQRLLKRKRLAPSEALCVGDEIRDAEAARAAGADFVGVAWGYAKPEALQPYSKGPLLQRLEDILTAVL